MVAEPTVLHGVSWDHPRGRRPLAASCEEVARASGGAIQVRWQARSLHEFESVPPAVLAARYDLLAIDHPFVGLAASEGSLWPLRDLLDSSFLAELAGDSAGPSADSYRWDGECWGLPMDAAAQVSAYRPDLLDELGLTAARTWDEVARLAAALPPGRGYVLAANPVHLLSALFTLSHQRTPGDGPVVDYPYPWWDSSGLDPAVCVPALEQLVELIRGADPRSWQLSPIGVLDLMASGDDLVYCPLVFGYVSYAHAGFATHRIAFADAPATATGRRGSLLGGVGLAVSRRCRSPRAASRVVRHVLSAGCQQGTYLAAGGQPGRRSAWRSRAANQASLDFFAATSATIDGAFVRPRAPGYPRFQRLAATALHDGARAGRPAAELIDMLNARWRAAGA